MSDPALDNIFVFNVYCVCNCTTQNNECSPEVGKPLKRRAELEKQKKKTGIRLDRGKPWEEKYVFEKVFLGASVCDFQRDKHHVFQGRLKEAWERNSSGENSAQLINAKQKRNHKMNNTLKTTVSDKCSGKPIQEHQHL